MEERFRTLRIVWVALMAGVASYSIVAYCVIAFGGIEPGMLPMSVPRLVAPVAALGMIVGASFRRRLVDAIPRSATPEDRLRKYTTATIVGLAIVEGSGLLIITVSLVSGAATWVSIGGGACVAVMALSSPSREDAGLAR